VSRETEDYNRVPIWKGKVARYYYNFVDVNDGCNLLIIALLPLSFRSSMPLQRWCSAASSSLLGFINSCRAYPRSSNFTNDS
jgi:hypothetical protein